jgi:hypothetical protein
MHVLSEHDAGGGHGMMVNPTAAAAHHSKHMAMPADVAMPAGGVTLAAAPASDGGLSSGMEACILFLAIGVSLILLALLVKRCADRKQPTGKRLWLWSVHSQRGPPGARPPRISLCVLRV